MIDNIINIDFIDQKQKIVHEVKKSRKIEQASVFQMKYYLYILKSRGADGFVGKIDYPLVKKNITVELSEEDEKKLNDAESEILEIQKSDKPPAADKKGYCRNCAYYDICRI